MSAIKQLLCDLTTDLVNKRGIDSDDVDTWLHIHSLITSGVIEPMDLEGTLWIRDNKCYKAEDLELIA